MKRRDVVVVGAGPAGSLAAREIARQGASVLLLDRADFPRWKVCGACLSAGALDVLESVGLGELLDALGAERLETLVLSARKRRVRLPLHGSRALSRLAFDRALLDAARESGVEFWSGARAQLGAADCEYRSLRVSRGSEAIDVRARVVLDATGLGPGLASARTEAGTVRAGSRIGLGAVLRDSAYPVEPGDLHMVVAHAGYVGLVRDESGRLNIAAAVDPSALHGTRPDKVIASILSSCGLEPLRGRHVAAWQGTPALTRSPATVAGERLFRLGDASGYVEPFTGEGMCWAMSSAVAVAPLALAGADSWDASLAAAWRVHHGAALRRARRLCRVLTPALRQPWLVQGALATLNVLPGLATPFVRRAARPPESSLAYSA